MKTFYRASWLITAIVGTIAGVVYFIVADRYAGISATGDPKFEMPFWWIVGESVLVGLLMALLASGIGAGVRRICCHKRQPESEGRSR